MPIAGVVSSVETERGRADSSGRVKLEVMRLFSPESAHVNPGLLECDAFRPRYLELGLNGTDLTPRHLLHGQETYHGISSLHELEVDESIYGRL